MGIALAGLAPDARILSNFLRQQSMSQKLVFNRPLPISRAVHAIADKAQANTQQYGRRPYGVGLLVAGFDESGPHLYEFLPSGSVLEYVGTAIGARSQAARTYLERNIESIGGASLEELVVHGLNALRDTLAQDKELTPKNTSVAVVGKDTPFKLIEEDDVAPWLERLESVSRTTHAQPAAEPSGDSMDTTQ
jgi:20S proteasome subunit alpha 6